MKVRKLTPEEFKKLLSPEIGRYEQLVELAKKINSDPATLINAFTVLGMQILSRSLDALGEEGGFEIFLDLLKEKFGYDFKNKNVDNR